MDIVKRILECEHKSDWPRRTFCYSPNFEAILPILKNSAAGDGGRHSWVCVRLTIRSAPIDTSGNFSVHGGGVKIV